MLNLTPLRYPGGKGRLKPYLDQLLASNGLLDAHYVEPFCGGAGLALALLADFSVSHIHLNDLDRAVYAFWHSAVNKTESLCKLIEDVDVTMESWRKQQAVWRDKNNQDLLELGFATFFLNRTNRSGILAGGVIGGKNQDGNWKIDARFNKVDLIKRITSIGSNRSRISVYNLEALDFLRKLQPSLPPKSLVYLDPPYVEKGPGLYLNSYTDEDHRSLAKWVVSELDVPWMVSYDDHELIRECYRSAQPSRLSLPYSAYGNGRRGTELVYFSNGLVSPTMQQSASRYRRPWQLEEAVT